MRSTIEYNEFYKKAIKEFGEEGKEEIVDLLASNPKAGKKIEGFGGLRRLSWTQKGKKEAEFNIYYHPGHRNLPLAIISMFRKNEKMILEKIIEILIHDKRPGLNI